MLVKLSIIFSAIPIILPIMLTDLPIILKIMLSLMLIAFQTAKNSQDNKTEVTELYTLCT